MPGPLFMSVRLGVEGVHTTGSGGCTGGTQAVGTSEEPKPCSGSALGKRAPGERGGIERRPTPAHHMANHIPLQTHG